MLGKKTNTFDERICHQIVVTDLYDPDTKYFATCKKWLAKDEGDGQIARDLILHKDAAGGRQSKEKKRKYSIDCEEISLVGNQYRVTVYTGNKRGAGTDADVFITLYGNKGESGAIVLDDKKNNFEAGKFVLIFLIRFIDCLDLLCE